MANTVIRIKSSGVTGNIPSTLEPGELAINYVDGKLYYGNNTNTTVLFDVITDPAGLDGEIQFNNFGSFGSSPNLRYDSSNNTLILTNLIVGSSNIVYSIANSFDKANASYNQANVATSIATSAYDSVNIFSSVITTSNGLVTFTNATEATDLSTASVVFTGGISVNKDILSGSDIIGTGNVTSNINGFTIDGGTY